MLQSEVKRRFRRFEGYRSIFTRPDKPDAMFLAFLNFAFIVEVIYDLA